MSTSTSCAGTNVGCRRFPVSDNIFGTVEAAGTDVVDGNAMVFFRVFWGGGVMCCTIEWVGHKAMPVSCFHRDAMRREDGTLRDTYLLRA